MQHRQTSRRRRPTSNNPRQMGQSPGGQAANRMEVRVRGNAHQLLEKYKQLARDSQQAGDRVASEFYLQHADHYFRVLNEGRARQEEMRARRNGGSDDAANRDTDDEMFADDGDGNRPERAERPERSERAERAEADSRSRRRRGRSERPRDSSDDSAPAVEVLELHVSDVSDGEAALAAFGGGRRAAKPAARPDADDSDSAAADMVAADAAADVAEVVEEAPKPRRRGRPRKAAQPTEG